MSRTGRRPLNPRDHKLEEATVRLCEEQELTVQCSSSISQSTTYERIEFLGDLHLCWT